MTIAEILGIVVNGVSALAVVISLFFVVSSNRRLSTSLRLSNMQAMVSEMNELRRLRAQNPDLERELFEKRSDWTALQIEKNLTAVQLANIFEWAYLARRDHLIERDVWESWVLTWRDVIMASESLKASFSDSVWTFGRQADVAKSLGALVKGSGEIPDPARRRSVIQSWIQGD